MTTFEFTLYLDRPLDHSPEGLDRLFEAGGDDASPATVNGQSYVAFHRDGESLEAAIQSAVETLRRAGYGVARIETDEWETINRLNQALAKT